jgi:hypothetical protein
MAGHLMDGRRAGVQQQTAQKLRAQRPVAENLVRKGFATRVTALHPLPW